MCASRKSGEKRTGRPADEQGQAGVPVLPRMQFHQVE